MISEAVLNSMKQLVLADPIDAFQKKVVRQCHPVLLLVELYCVLSRENFKTLRRSRYRRMDRNS
ncbi:hypothetical protein BE15_10520 [Sorangium cellulosum]|uniref:Uncharacterized protein n=1 Tax=Sorangium cellulosum TaxID=56 RepID=A0A150QK97_SORCE|nr:hypothetical protein BE15_10520 [Sorangium cellulosum]